MTQRFLITSSVMGSTAVLLGTFGTNILYDHIDNVHMFQFVTGFAFQMFTAIILLAIAFMNRYVVRAYLNAIYFLFLIGTTLFSLPMYLMSIAEITGEKLAFMWPITRIGVVVMFFGWVVLFFAGLKYKHKKRIGKK